MSPMPYPSTGTDADGVKATPASHQDVPVSQLLTETRMTLAELARREKTNPATVHRWAMKGLGGIRLESFKVGGRRHTTQEAFTRFVARSSERLPGVELARPADRESLIERAEARLRQEGV